MYLKYTVIESEISISSRDALDKLRVIVARGRAGDILYVFLERADRREIHCKLDSVEKRLNI